MIILEKENLPHPRCSRCDMMIPWRSLNGRHNNTAMCRSGAERKRRRLEDLEIRESTEVELYQRIHGRRRRGTKYLSDRVPHQGGDEGMPSGGLPGKGWDADGDEGSFLAQICLGCRDHLGGGKPPTSKVLTM